MKRVSLLLVLLLSCSVSAVQMAEHKGHIKVKAKRTEPEVYKYRQTSISMVADFYIEWKLSLLLGEPVRYSEGRWSLSYLIVNRKGKEELWYPCHKRYDNSPCLPESVWRKIRIAKAIFSIEIGSGNLPPRISFDPGVYAESAHRDAETGKVSFNTPGSPNWDKLFYKKARYSNDEPDWLSEAQAKALFNTRKLNMHSADLNSFSADYSAVFNYWLEQEKARALAEKTAEMRKKRDEKLQRVDKSQNDDPFALFEAEYIEEEYQQKTQQQANAQSRDFRYDDKVINKIKASANSIWAKRKREINSHTLPTELLKSFSHEGLYGFKDEKGNIVIPAKYDSVEEFSDGLAAVQLKFRGKWGYINSKGVMVIPLQFSSARQFSEGLAPVVVDDEGWDFINKQGEVVISGGYKNAKPFKDGLATVEDNFHSRERNTSCTSYEYTWDEYEIDNSGQRQSAVRKKSDIWETICLMKSD